MTGSPFYATYSVAQGGRTITYRCIHTHHDNITIKDIDSAHIGNAAGSPYGVNGTFFYTSTSYPPAGYSRGDIYRICMNNGAVVHAHGEKNRLDAYADGDCGTLGWLKQPIGGEEYFCQDITTLSDVLMPNGTQVGLSNIQWAIGGVNLYLSNNSMTESSFNSAVHNQAGGVETSPTARTAIFYCPNEANDIVLLTGFGSSGTGIIGTTNGPTLWQVREFIRGSFGQNCLGISLDGGGSTQIAYKSGSSRVCVQADDRAVHVMVQTSMA